MDYEIICEIDGTVRYIGGFKNLSAVVDHLKQYAGKVIFTKVKHYKYNGDVEEMTPSQAVLNLGIETKVNAGKMRFSK